jgi:hypothetical protein
MFPHFEMTAGMGCILWMCAASLVYHQETVLASNANHIARTISLFLDPTILQPCQGMGINPSFDWRTIPCQKLVNLQALREEQSKLSDTIFMKVMGGLADYFDTRQIGSGEMMEARIKELIALACKQNTDELVKHVKTTVTILKTAFLASSFGNGIRPVRQDAEDATYTLTSSFQKRAFLTIGSNGVLATPTVKYHH